jgi:hypothetical protein
MTAPFNPTGLARKWADEIRQDQERVRGGYTYKYDSLETVLTLFARDLIRESGAMEALSRMSGNCCDSLHHDKSEYHKGSEPCPVEAKLKRAIANLRSITEAERGGVK